MSDWAPYLVARIDLPFPETVGRTFTLEIALGMLRVQNRTCPEQEHVIVWDGGVLTEVEAEELLNKRATEKMNHHLKLLRKVA